MGVKRITDYLAAATLAGTGLELVEIAQPSLTVTITAATISAAAADNSFNDSANGFVAAGFAAGDRVHVAGFTGNVANNILVGIVGTLTVGKMTILSTEGDVIVDDAAGESVTITKWVSRRQAIGTAVDLNKDTDVTLAANSDSRLATQKAVKAYVDGKVVGLFDDKGPIDCSANPNYPAALKGDAYHVTVAGKIGGGAGIDVDIGDLIAASADNAGGTQAAVGASWYILEHNLVGVVPASGGTFTGDINVPAEVYGAGWNASNEAPTKNDVYDKIESVIAGVPGAYTDEQARDAIGAAAVAGSGMAIVVDDAGDTITFSQGPLTISTQAGTTYTLVLADKGTHIRLTHASGCVVTVPLNATVAFPVGTRIRFTSAGAAASSLIPVGGGVTLNSRGAALTAAGQFAVFEIEKVATDVWDVLGDLV